MPPQSRAYNYSFMKLFLSCPIKEKNIIFLKKKKNCRVVVLSNNLMLREKLKLIENVYFEPIKEKILSGVVLSGKKLSVFFSEKFFFEIFSFWPKIISCIKMNECLYSYILSMNC